MSGGIIEEKAVHDALDALLRAREHPGADTTTNPSLKRCYPEDTDRASPSISLSPHQFSISNISDVLICVFTVISYH
ncbi:hypothetical protein KIN20_009036 [Parelaphostrongylus tenuis]|uniref:Uncharacterized protein n=1 Tax=Parelaphostrongylus tenuis TaxID=148309 RepID=A0AAD5MQ13_PARTN|nr:hypothetical protein KIN20_009028 [Parelaphostrongylus tenuis]KAJ1352642.1 hypothetical protein KIN20_009036 [Parelaphostrongylus tenuis]